MSRINKKQKALKAWKHAFSDMLNPKKSVGRINHYFEALARLYGPIPGYLWYVLRHETFHNIIVPAWLSSTNIEPRRFILDRVSFLLGKGYAYELKKISNSFTW
jgi:hypothetical protein